jgi:hypothetical protein
MGYWVPGPCRTLRVLAVMTTILSNAANGIEITNKHKSKIKPKILIALRCLFMPDPSFSGALP